jgi:hypothetical protein
MPYSLIFKYSDGTVGGLKPLACDNPKSIYGFEDKSIERKAEHLAAELTKRYDDLECYVVHYD